MDAFAFDLDDTSSHRPTGYRLRSADGRMMYPISDAGIPARLSWSDGIEVLNTGGYPHSSFLIVPAGQTTAEHTTRVRGPVTGFRRRIANDTLPETVTADDWDAFRSSAGYDDDGDAFADRFYDREYAADIVNVHQVDLTGFVDLPVDVETIEDPDPSLPWEVAVTHLVYGAVYASVLPGVMKGAGEQIAEAVKKAVPHATVWTHKVRETGTVSGYVTLAYEDGRTYPVKEGRRTIQRNSAKNFEFDFSVPRDIVAASKAAAVQQYRTVIDEIIDSIETAKPVVCAHCSGEGVVAALPVAKKR